MRIALVALDTAASAPKISVIIENPSQHRLIEPIAGALDPVCFETLHQQRWNQLIAEGWLAEAEQQRCWRDILAIEHARQLGSCASARAMHGIKDRLHRRLGIGADPKPERGSVLGRSR